MEILTEYDVSAVAPASFMYTTVGGIIAAIVFLAGAIVFLVTMPHRSEDDGSGVATKRRTLSQIFAAVCFAFVAMSVFFVDASVQRADAMWDDAVGKVSMNDYVYVPIVAKGSDANGVQVFALQEDDGTITLAKVLDSECYDTFDVGDNLPMMFVNGKRCLAPLRK